MLSDAIPLSHSHAAKAPLLPRVGLGTFKAQGQDVKMAVKAALAANIRHIDTAAIYKV